MVDCLCLLKPRKSEELSMLCKLSAGLTGCYGRHVSVSFRQLIIRSKFQCDLMFTYFWKWPCFGWGDVELWQSGKMQETKIFLGGVFILNELYRWKWYRQAFWYQVSFLRFWYLKTCPYSSQLYIWSNTKISPTKILASNYALSIMS